MMMIMTEESRMFDRLSISRYAPLNVMDYVQSFDDQFSLLFYIIGIWFADESNLKHSICFN